MGRPMFSLVVTVLDGARFLPEFLASVEDQSFGDFEVIAVDGGTDAVATRHLTEWVARADNVRLIPADGASVAAARNLGLAAATGSWVGFPRAQDRLPKGYLARLAAVIGAGTTTAALAPHPDPATVSTSSTGEVSGRGATPIAADGLPSQAGAPVSGRTTQPDLVATRKKRFTDRRKTQPDPLASMFDRTRLLDLTEEPTRFHTDLDTAFFPLDGLHATGLRFDERVSPNFNGGHFCARWLLTRERPQVLVVREAVYGFRVRPPWLPIDPTLRDPRRFREVPQIGFLQLLRDAGQLPAGIPDWLKSAVLYELSQYLRRDQQVTRTPSVQAGPLADEFRATVAEIVRLIGQRAARGLGFLTPEWEHVLFHGLTGEPFVASHPVADRYDIVRDEVRVWFSFVGEEPAWQVLDGERPVRPSASKLRGVQYFGTVVLQKRIAWVPVRDSLSVVVDGRALPVVLSVEPQPGATVVPRTLTAAALREELAPDRSLVKAGLSLGERWAVLRSRLPWIRKRYRDAWIVMDRLTDADDNGERLFEYLRTARPDINAWFVLAPDSADLSRMRETHGGRVVAHGSSVWYDLALNCRTLASSHLTPAILNPPALRHLPRLPWAVAFLQHGVVRDDVSRWFNRQTVDLIVASTPAEFASFVADGTNYELTTKEARLVGLPRFDRLLQLGVEYPPPERDLVLVAPTWRNDLQVSDSRKGLSQGFLESDFARNWLGLLNDTGFRDAVAEAGLRIGFLPHPNLQQAVPELSLPDDIEVLGYAGQDVQRFIARAAVQVTDYSSMAFNSAYLDRPVVYFQFDREAYFSGANNSRPGYFDFERDGFGPVTTTVAETAEATRRLLAGDTAEYLARIRATFPGRDGRCCERTVAAIEALTAAPTSLPATSSPAT